MSAPTPVSATTQKALLFLCLVLIFALTDLSLSLVHLGLTSFLLGIVASGATVIHTLTQLATIAYRSRRSKSHPPALPLMTHQGDDLPPTSKMASLAMDTLLAVLFAGAFVTTIVVQKLGYFIGLVGDPHEGEGTFRVFVKVVYADAAMEMLCAITLIALIFVGLSERRRILRVEKEIPASSRVGSR